MKENIQVSNSQVRFIRVSYANILMFISFICLVLVNQVMIDFGVQSFVRIISLIALTLFWVKLYLSCIGSIQFDKEKIIYTNAIRKKSIPLSSIVNIHLYTVPSSVTIVLQIKSINKLLPKMLILTSPSTNVGNFKDTVEFIKKNIALLGKGD